MRYNLKRHLLLKILTNKFVTENEIQPLAKNINSDIVGLSFEEIEKTLKISPIQREMILSELDKSEEVIFFNLKEKGCFINEKNGISSFTDKKYILRNRNIIIGWIKDFVQIVIPVLALIVAILSITTKIDKFRLQTDKDLNTLKVLIVEQMSRIENLEENVKSNDVNYDSQ